MAKISEETTFIALMSILQIIVGAYMLHTHPADISFFGLSFVIMITYTILFALGFKRIAFLRQSILKPDWDLNQQIQAKTPHFMSSIKKTMRNIDAYEIEKGHIISRMLSHSKGLNFWRPREIVFGVAGMTSLIVPAAIVLIVGSITIFLDLLLTPFGEPIFWSDPSRFNFALLFAYMPAGILGVSIGGVLGGYKAYWKILGKSAIICNLRGKDITEKFLVGPKRDKEVIIKFRKTLHDVSYSRHRRKKTDVKHRAKTKKRIVKKKKRRR